MMDASAVIAMAKWILAELVRVFHTTSTDDAQRTVDSVAEITLPIIWSDGIVKRVLDTSLKLGQQILVLLSSCPAGATIAKLVDWIEPDDEAYFRRALRKLDKGRFIELNEKTQEARILPPGAISITTLVTSQAMLP